MRVNFVLELIPDVTGKALGQKRCGARREDREATDVSGLLKVGSTLGLLFSSARCRGSYRAT